MLPARCLFALGFSSILLFGYLFPDGRIVPRWARWPAVASVVLESAAQFALAHMPPDEDFIPDLRSVKFKLYVAKSIRRAADASSESAKQGRSNAESPVISAAMITATSHSAGEEQRSPVENRATLGSQLPCSDAARSDVIHDEHELR